MLNLIKNGDISASVDNWLHWVEVTSFYCSFLSCSSCTSSTFRASAVLPGFGPCMNHLLISLGLSQWSVSLQRTRSMTRAAQGWAPWLKHQYRGIFLSFYLLPCDLPKIFWFLGSTHFGPEHPMYEVKKEKWQVVASPSWDHSFFNQKQSFLLKNFRCPAAAVLTRIPLSCSQSPS